jgi:hypothetical protein
MRLVILATGAAIAFAGSAQAQFAPIKPIEPPKNPYALPKAGAATFQPYKPPEPFKPFIGQSTYDDGPFSPAAEARRARKAAEPPKPGPFSPEAEAKRARDQAKGYHPYY